MVVSKIHAVNGAILTGLASAAPGAVVICEPRLLCTALTGSVALPQAGSVLMSIAPNKTKDHANFWGLYCPLRPVGGLSLMVQLRPYRSECIALPLDATMTSSTTLHIGAMLEARISVDVHVF